MARFATLTLRTLLGIGALSLVACDGDEVGNVTSGSGGAGGNEGGEGGSGAHELPLVDKVDLVLAIDNSGSMADKEEILRLALDDMIGALTRPPCFDASGIAHAIAPSNPCPSGMQREFAPVTDMHVGVITSSLGSFGAPACAESPGGDLDDHGRLVSRALGGGIVETYEDKGFLVWDPLARSNPPGESDSAAFVSSVRAMVRGVGETGCGFESQLESWYRFLADPDPYATVQKVGNAQYRVQGTDEEVLAQRKSFLRTDSLLAVVMLSDEDDCSVVPDGFNPAALDSPHLPGPTAACATDPNDPCCASCGMATPEGCEPDPTCSAALSDAADRQNLRCWDQKRRFGFSSLHPTERYVNALTSPQVPDRHGHLVSNPIFSDIEGTGKRQRDPGLVVLAGLVGVPWQDVAIDPTDPAKGIKTADDLAQPNGSGMTTWDAILGEPGAGVAPKDPFMIASPSPRSGTNPITGDPIKAPGASSPNPINGTEYSEDVAVGDLQFACITPLPTPRDCTGTGSQCDCSNSSNDSPLCAANPADGGNRTLQVAAKAYPATRQLSVLKAVGAQGVVSSICPSNITDPSKGDYAYRPMVKALIDQMKTRLERPE